MPTPRPAPQVVLVEDSAADVGLVREALQEYQVSCELTVIVNGERAVKFVDEIDAGEHSCPDLFIIDLNLPRKPGKVVLERVRASSNCQTVPIIVLTSSDSQKDKDEVAGFSPSRYIRKPSKLDDFVQLGAVFKQLLYPDQ
jgi:DNA-binding response OmpR family regulator